MVSTRSSKAQIAPSSKAPNAPKATKAERKPTTIPIAVAIAPVLLALFIYLWYYTGVFSDADRIACDVHKQARYDHIRQLTH